MQDYKSKRIRIFKNGDVFTPSKKFVISPKLFRNYEQFLHTSSNELKLLTGAVRKIYTIEGKPVGGLDDFEEGGTYVATSGEFFKKAPYLLKEQQQPESASKKGDPRAYLKSWNDKTFLAETINEGKKEIPLFQPTSKAYRILAYSNGENNTPGIRLLLNYRTCRTFDQLLRFLSNTLHLSVRKIYDGKNGRQIKTLQDLRDGQVLIGAGNENYKEVNYLPRSPLDNGQSRREQEHIKNVNFFPNGDAYHHGFVVKVQKSRFDSIKKLLDHLNKSGSVGGIFANRIFSMKGKQIKDLDDLEHQQSYVLLSGSEQFFNINYNVNSIQALDAPKGLSGFTKNNELMSKIKFAKPIWAVQKLKAAPQKSQPQPIKNKAKKPATAQEDIEEEDTAKVIGDDDGDVFESKDINAFNPKELQNSEVSDNEEQIEEIENDGTEQDSASDADSELLKEFANSKEVGIEQDEEGRDTEKEDASDTEEDSQSGMLLKLKKSYINSELPDSESKVEEEIEEKVGAEADEEEEMENEITSDSQEDESASELETEKYPKKNNDNNDDIEEEKEEVEEDEDEDGDEEEEDEKEQESEEGSEEEIEENEIETTKTSRASINASIPELPSKSHSFTKGQKKSKIPKSVNSSVRSSLSSIQDVCGCWHIECLLQLQKNDLERFKYSNKNFEVINSEKQIAGFSLLKDEDKETVAKKFFV
ncbi:Serine/threonine-protein kinase dclk1 [Lobulomyces angularis]|nr:Serine/threonine-protein kinase dclk1 [Lobulomyces angularis]